MYFEVLSALADVADIFTGIDAFQLVMVQRGVKNVRVLTALYLSINYQYFKRSDLII